jgi:hypothetical protein
VQHDAHVQDYKAFQWAFRDAFVFELDGDEFVARKLVNSKYTQTVVDITVGGDTYTGCIVSGDVGDLLMRLTTAHSKEPADRCSEK